MQLQSAEAKTDINRRLRRVEGQIRGIQGMVADDRECREVVQQLNAAAAALRNTTQLLMRTYAGECLQRAEKLDAGQAQLVINELMDLMARVR